MMEKTFKSEKFVPESLWRDWTELERRGIGWDTWDGEWKEVWVERRKRREKREPHKVARKSTMPMSRVKSLKFHYRTFLYSQGVMEYK